MDIANNFYTELQSRQRELHAKIRDADEDETEKNIKALHKKLETIDRLITLVLKYIYDTKSV